MNDKNIRLSQLSALTDISSAALHARIKNTLHDEILIRGTNNHILLEPHQIKRLISDRIIDVKGKIIYIGILKGGTGKTAISYFLANILYFLGFKICILDLDVQANITNKYTQVKRTQPVFYDIIKRDNPLNIQDIIIPIYPSLHVIPSSLRNNLITTELAGQQPKNHFTWFNSLCLNYLRDHYDVVIVDTPPHLTSLNSIFCLCLKETDDILIPACAEADSISGAQMFLNDILAIRNSYNITANTNIIMLINRFIQNQNTQLECLLEIKKEFGELLSEIVMKDSVKIREIIAAKGNNNLFLPLIKHGGKEILELFYILLQEINILKKSG